VSLGGSKLASASFPVRYGTATLLVLAAAVMRVGLSLLINRPVSAPLFLMAVIYTTWLGGLRLGIYASLISGLVLDFYFAQPQIGSLTTYDHLVRFAMLVAEGTLVSWLINKLRIASDELIASREELRGLSERQRTERDAELKKIAREIHDELGQDLTSLKLDIHLLKRNAERSADERERVLSTGFDEVSERVDATIEKVRRISSEMRPSILDDFGLVAALDWQVKEFARKTAIECEFKYDSESIELDPDANTAIFRIVQEALTNIARHAQATKASVSMFQAKENLCLRIEDDGRGIEPIMLKGRRSLGLLGMRERARLIDAELTITGTSHPSGTLVELTAPIAAADRKENGR